MDTAQEVGKSSTELLVNAGTVPDDAWDDAWPFLEKSQSLWGIYNTPETLRLLVDQGYLQMWRAQQGGETIAVALTQVTPYAACKECAVIFLTGHSPEAFLPLLEGIETWAVSVGATRMLVQGRRGWVRALKPYGYGNEGAIVTKSLARRTAH